jgi:hypothetical protein
MPDFISRRQAWGMMVLLSVVAYAPTLRVGFLWDDHVLIEQNPYIRSWSATHLQHDFDSTVSNGQGDAGFLRPVVTWSTRVDYSLWKLRPAGYHFTNLLLHTCNAILVYELILLLGYSPMAAFLTGTLFAVHPIGVEGLLTVTGRATFLSFFFGLAALLLLNSPTPARFLLGLLSFTLALLSKEQSIIVPFLTGLVWTVQRVPRRRFFLLLPLLMVLGIYLAYRHYVFGKLGAPSDPLYTARFYAQAFPRVLTHYVALLFVPWNLHSHRLIMRLSHVWFLSLAGWLALVLWSYRHRQRFPWLFFSVFWLVIGLVPPSFAMVYGGFMLDHWGYWVAPAMLLPLSLLFDWLWSQGDTSRYKRAALLYFPILMAYALLTRLNIELRNTDEKMYRWALHFTTSHPIQYNLGMLLLESGRPEEALPYLVEYHDAYPEDPHGAAALAEALRQLHQGRKGRVIPK